MGNVTLPTPVFLAGGAFCLVAGYLAGAVIGPDDRRGDTAEVVSYDSGTSKLCLVGESVEDESGASDDGVLCGTWSRSTGSIIPREGDTFRFITMDTTGVKGAKPRDSTVIYGTVVE